MRELFINGRFLSQRVTGVQRYARELVVALDRILASESASERWTLLTPPGVTSTLPLERIDVRAAGVGRGHLWEQTSLFALTRHGVLVNLGNSGPIAHPRSVTVIHDAVVYRRPHQFARPYRTLHRALGRALARTSTLATVSRFSRSELADVLRVPPSAIHVVPNGAEHMERARPRPEALAPIGVEPGRYFLFVGSPAPHKNVATAVAAFQSLGDPQLALVVCGAADAAVFGRQAPISGVVHARHVDDQDIAALYESARALVFPSFYEGFGLPPLEAMVRGAPVLASDIPPCREVCGDAALYFAPTDVARLAALMRDVGGDETLRARLVAAGYERRKAFRWETSARAMLDLVRDERRAARA